MLAWRLFNFLAKTHSRVLSRLHVHIDQRFDRQRNIETREVVCISDLEDDIDFSDYDIDELYAGTPSSLFKALHAPARHKKCKNITYIDIGSGKSRMLIQAAEAGFKNIIGVEFSPSLAELGRENCQASIEKNYVNWDVKTKDATNFMYPDGDLVIFMFNPFDKIVFESFLDNLIAHIDDDSRSVVIIYNHAHYAHLLDENKYFKRVAYPFLARTKLKLLNPHSFGAWEYNFSRIDIVSQSVN